MIGVVLCIAILVIAVWASTRGLPRRDPHPTRQKQTEIQKATRSEAYSRRDEESEAEQKLVPLVFDAITRRMEQHRRFELRDEVLDAEVVDDAPQIEERKWLKS
jgi:hypothetical protein